MVVNRFNRNLVLIVLLALIPLAAFWSVNPVKASDSDGKNQNDPFIINIEGMDPETAFEERVERYLASIPSDQPGGAAAVASLASGKEIESSLLADELRAISNHGHKSNFKMTSLIRMLYLYGDDPRLTPEVRKAVEDALLKAKYWIDEPGRDDLCFWSENHQIVYHSDEYLAGALFPDQVFVNSGLTGREQMEKGKRLAFRWMDWRARFGFSEWLSNIYYKVDINALLNLADFAPDKDVRERASMILDLMALDMALNSFQGYQLSTHGRTLDENILTPRREGTGAIMWLWWETRDFAGEHFIDKAGAPDRAAVSLATTTYRLPPAIHNIGQSLEVMENHQVNGIAPEEAPAVGLPLDELSTGMYFWGAGMISHHLIADTTVRMWDEYDLYENNFFRGFARLSARLSKVGLLDDFSEHVPVASRASFLEDAHINTYRTPDYILSSVMDHRPGEIDAQNFAWVAAMGPDAKVFTTHPGEIYSSNKPSYWAGNAANPRVAQEKNVAVIIYNGPILPALGTKKYYRFTHAFFERENFDEVRSEGKWTFAKKGDGYLALYSRNKTKWTESGKWAGQELKAPGLENIWVCEMGRADDWGSFKNFVAAVSGAKIQCKGPNVAYQSPSRGLVEFGWTGPFMVDGKEVPLKRGMRYDNPYVRAPRFPRRLEINAGGSGLVLDFENWERTLK